jgi:hypothetical protein
MQDAGPVCAFSEDRYQVPGTGFGGRPSALGPRPGQRRREGRTSLAPHPSMAEGRIPRTEPGDRLSGTWDLVPGIPAPYPTNNS